MSMRILRRQLTAEVYVTVMACMHGCRVLHEMGSMDTATHRKSVKYKLGPSDDKHAAGTQGI